MSVSLLMGFGDSNTVLGWGSMTGVVQIKKEAGTLCGTGGLEESAGKTGVAADSCMGERLGRTESIWDSTVSKTVAGVTSVLAKSGSVMHEAVCKGVDDSRFSLLMCIMPSLPNVVMGIVDKADTE